MANTVVNVDHVICAGPEKARREVKANRHFVKRFTKMLSVDADGFCESKDWPYLWYDRHSGNRK